MTRLSDLSLRRVTVTIVFLCMTALAFCQVLGPTARLNYAFGPADAGDQTYAGVALRTAGAHGHLPTRCASIKLAPVEIESASFEPVLVACDPTSAQAAIPPHGAEIGVPTPPPRAA